MAQSSVEGKLEAYHFHMLGLILSTFRSRREALDSSPIPAGLAEPRYGRTRVLIIRAIKAIAPNAIRKIWVLVIFIVRICGETITTFDGRPATCSADPQLRIPRFSVSAASADRSVSYVSLHAVANSARSNRRCRPSSGGQRSEVIGRVTSIC